MQRVSTNLTLFFKFFIPVFWGVLFGLVTLAVWLAPADYFGDTPMSSLRWGMTFFFVTGAALFILTLLPLLRVEMDEFFILATNYFKTARYPYHNVERITESRFIGLTLVTVYLKVPGQFGRRLRFLASHRLYQDFKAEHPQVAALVQ